jgi:hypothetical protein
MIIGILYNKSYEDILVNVKQEICDFFDPSVLSSGYTPGKGSGGIQHPESFPDFYKQFMECEYQMIGGVPIEDFEISEDDVFEVYIKGPEDENAEYNEIWPGHYTTTIFSKKKLGRLPNDNEIIEFLEFLASEESIYVRRRVVIEGADIFSDSDHVGVEHLI